MSIDVDCQSIYLFFVALSLLFIAACHMPLGFDPRRTFCSVAAAICAAVAAIAVLVC